MAGDEGEQEAVLSAIGGAISNWSLLEHHHCQLFCTAITTLRESRALSAAYWAIVTFEGRQKMVDAALTETFADNAEFLPRWRTLNTKLGSKSKIRNKLAHGQTISFHEQDGTPVVKLMPYFFGRFQEHVEGDFVQGMRLQDIIGASAAIRALKDDLIAFGVDILNSRIRPEDCPKDENAAGKSTALPPR